MYTHLVRVFTRAKTDADAAHPDDADAIHLDDADAVNAHNTDAIHQDNAERSFAGSVSARMEPEVEGVVNCVER